MMKNQWRVVRDAIEQDIKDGILEPGAKLPTEQELVSLYGTGRHSVRRAIHDLARLGHVSVEQGRGTFVQAQPLIDYAIGKRTRLHQNLNPQGIVVAGEVLGAERVPAKGRVVRALALEKGAEVIVTRRITFADDVPLSFGKIHHDAARFPEFPERRAEMGSTSAVYRSYGVDDYVRANTTMHARPARADEAATLRQHPDLPVMVIRAIDSLRDGTPISYAEAIWAAARVKFVMSPDED